MSFNKSLLILFFLPPAYCFIFASQLPPQPHARVDARCRTQLPYKLVGGQAYLSQPARGQLEIICRAESSDDEFVNGDDTAEVEYYSKRKQSEERYPYEVYDTAPPRDMIGVFSLPPMLGCGDILRIDSERAYVIKRVASRFRYTDGKFHLDSKRADATEINRAAAEKKLARLLAGGK